MCRWCRACRWPPEVEKLTRPLVVGLYASPERIVQIRENRLLGLKAHRDDDQYIDKAAVAEEVAYSRRLCAKHNWPSIDVTRRSIEETAAAVMKLLTERRRRPVACAIPTSGTGFRIGSRETIMPLWLAPQPLVLASKSDVRGKMLAAAGLRFEIRPAQIDERAVGSQSRRRRCGRRRAPAGARQGRRRGDAACPVGWCSAPTRRWRAARARFGKPAEPRGGAEQLRALRGRTHELHSALALVRDGKVLFDCVDSARLTMRNFSDRFLDDYLDMAGDAALASVGAYQLEGIGIHLFERVEGDYFTILGLPLLPLLAFSAAETKVAVGRLRKICATVTCSSSD